MHRYEWDLGSIGIYIFIPNIKEAIYLVEYIDQSIDQKQYDDSRMQWLSSKFIWEKFKSNINILLPSFSKAMSILQELR